MSLLVKRYVISNMCEQVACMPVAHTSKLLTNYLLIEVYCSIFRPLLEVCRVVNKRHPYCGDVSFHFLLISKVCHKR